MPRLPKVNFMSDSDNKENENSNQENAEQDSENNQGNDGGDSGANSDANKGDENHSELLTEDEIDAITDPDELKEKLKLQAKLQQRNFERAKKAEGFVRTKDGKWVKKQKTTPPANNANQNNQQPQKGSDDLSSMDTLAFVNAKVTNPEDIAEVRDYAKLKGISVGEALQAPIVKTLLKESAEFRTTANATNTGPTRRGNTQPSAKNLLDKASKTGELPDTEEGMAALADAQIEQLANKNANSK